MYTSIEINTYYTLLS